MPLSRPRFHCLEHGQGLPLVMLHGVLGEPSHWQPLFSHLPAGLRAIALELPFIHPTAGLTSVAAVRQHVQDYLDHSGLKRCILAGNSIGGHVALLLAAAWPERVAGLLLTGAGGLVERRFGSLPGTEPPLAWIRERVREVFHNQAVVTEELVQRIHGVICDRASRKQLVALFRSVRSDCVAELLPQVRCPALLLWGRHDSVTPPAAAERFQALLPDSELHWLPGSGHAPMLEEPERFARHLRDWWQRRIEGRVSAPAMQAEALLRTA